MGDDSEALGVTEVGKREAGRKALGLVFNLLYLVHAFHLLLVHFEKIVVDIVLDGVVFLAPFNDPLGLFLLGKNEGRVIHPGRFSEAFS